MKLTEENFVLYAAKYYDNPSCFTEEEFISDLKRFQYLKKLLNRYTYTGDIQERLVLNHIIILYNVFGLAATNMLFMKLLEHAHVIKPFLVFLNYMPETFIEFEDKRIHSSDIPMDPRIVDYLRELERSNA